mgnify:CR=1 FL=1
MPSVAFRRIEKLLPALSQDELRVLIRVIELDLGPTPDARRMRVARAPNSSPNNGPPRAPNSSPEQQGALDNVVPTVVSRSFRSEALEVLHFLNEKTSRNYRDTDTNLRLIEARLRSGASVQDCKSIVARKFLQWKDDTKMRIYLRPGTLFRASKFEDYLGELEVRDAK